MLTNPCVDQNKSVQSKGAPVRDHKLWKPTWLLGIDFVQFQYEFNHFCLRRYNGWCRIENVGHIEACICWNENCLLPETLMSFKLVLSTNQRDSGSSGFVDKGPYANMLLLYEDCYQDVSESHYTYTINYHTTHLFKALLHICPLFLWYKKGGWNFIDNYQYIGYSFAQFYLYKFLSSYW